VSNMNNLRSQFQLRDDITFLNFGSFGSCPKPIFEKFQQYQLELEQEPVQFITVTNFKYLKESREALGNYINCHADDLVFVPNPSHAVNIIAKSFPLQKNDEILTTNIEYGACDKTWQYYCDKVGAKYVRQQINFPIASKEQIVDDLFKGISSKTKLVFISHITSSTGLRLPVEEICAKAKSLGLLTFVDGAHAPGHIPLDLSTLHADMYTGACHKWMMTPKGSSFLYVKKERQYLADPLVVSWGYKAMYPSHSTFLDYHQTQGTRDTAAFYCIPAAIKFMEENNWAEVAKSCRKMVQDNAERFCKLLNATPLCPVNDNFILQLYSTKIKTTEPEKLHDYFLEKYKIQVPVMRQEDNVYIRYSINAFNTQEDLDKLFDALNDIKKTTTYIHQ
jgi:isopenicillin-N epimerase